VGSNPTPSASGRGKVAVGAHTRRYRAERLTLNLTPTGAAPGVHLIEVREESVLGLRIDALPPVP
jgi:hypothetical protein